MFWPFRIRPRRQSARPSDYARLGIEVLEGHRDETTAITDIFPADATTVPDERTQTIDHLVTLFDLELVAPNDALIFDLVGIYSQRLADILVPPGEE